MPKNPHWNEDELILALDLYFRINVSSTSPKHPEIENLSNILRSLPLHPESVINEGFRSPDSVYMKLCNFLRLDPGYSGKGLDAGSKLDIVIWDEYAGDKKRLHQVAQMIRKNGRYIKDKKIEIPSDDLIDEATATEGKLLQRLHRYRERDAGMAKKKKTQVLKAKGKLACEVCDFDFAEVYGPLGEGFAECHHIVPLSEFDFQKTVRLSDLAIVCANCHRMLHRGKPRKSIQELRELITIGLMV